MDAIQLYYLLHVISMLLLSGSTFHAFADPDPDKRRRMLIITGVLSLAMLTGGFGLLARIHNNVWSDWVIIKLVCWLVLSAMAGLAWRLSGMIAVLRVITIAVLSIGVWAVYARPDGLF